MAFALYRNKSLRGQQFLFPGVHAATMQTKIIGCACYPQQLTALYAYIYEWMDFLFHSFIMSKPES
jgi:hypothetical protein